MEPLINSQQLASHLNVKIYTVRAMTRRGEIPYFKIGAAVRYRLSDVLQRMEQTA